MSDLVTFSRAHSQKRPFGAFRRFATTFANKSERLVYKPGAPSETIFG